MTNGASAMPDPHPSSDVVEQAERLRALAMTERELGLTAANRQIPLALDRAAATIERLSAQLEQATRVDEATSERIRAAIWSSTGCSDSAAVEATNAVLDVLSVLPVIGGE